MASPPPDYQPMVDYSLPVQSIRVTNLVTGDIHQLTLFPSKRRRDCYRVLVNGRQWKRSIGYDRMLRGLRTALVRKPLATAAPPCDK